MVHKYMFSQLALHDCGCKPWDVVSKTLPLNSPARVLVTLLVFKQIKTMSCGACSISKYYAAGRLPLMRILTKVLSILGILLKDDTRAGAAGVFLNTRVNERIWENQQWCLW